MNQNATFLSKPTQEFCRLLAAKPSPLRLEFIASAPSLAALPKPLCYEIAVVGRSNVGKSSLLNFVAGQKQLARVSNMPGRTQMLNLFYAEKRSSGLPQFAVIDLPGYGFALSPKDVQNFWAQNMQEFFTQRVGLLAVLFLLDVRRELEEEDVKLIQWLQTLGLKLRIVQTKVDKVNKSELEQHRLAVLRILNVLPEHVLATSTLKKIGLQSINKALSQIFFELWQNVSPNP